jgi:hypothetical protein
LLSRDEALQLITTRVRNKNLVKHMLATEAIMKALAKKFAQDEEKWGLAGLLHDLDYDDTLERPELHGKISVEILKEKGLSADVMHAILAHAEKVSRENLMDKALYAVDPLTGFLVACALMTPDKKLASLDLGFALRRFKEKAFARGASRDQMRSCEDFGLQLEEFISIGIEAMQKIATELGL